MISEAEGQRLHIGYKQSLRALNDAKAEKLLVALDCEDRLREPLKKAAAEHNVAVTEIETMRELGAMCKIEVGASCAVVLKD